MGIKAFNQFDLSVRTLEGGNIVKATLSLDGEVVDQSERIVTGKPGSTILASRLRKAIKASAELAFPKVEAVAVADIPGQQTLPGTV